MRSWSLESLLKFILLFAVFSIPLLTPRYNFSFEQIKVSFFIFITIFSTILALFLSSRKKEALLGWNKIRVAATVFIFIIFATSILGVNPEKSFLGAPPYYQGIVLYGLLYLFSIVINNLKINLKLWSVVLISSGVIISVFAIKDYLLINLFNSTAPIYAGRVISTLGQPNFYSGFIVLCTPFLYAFSIYKGLRQIYLFIITLFAIAILVSFSKTAIILFLGYLIYKLTRSIKLKKLKYLIATIALAIVTSFWVGRVIDDEILKPLSFKNPQLSNYSIERRLLIWQTSIDIFLQKPIAGYGFDSISDVFPTYTPSESLRETTYFGIKDLQLDRTHNYLLDLLFFSGVGGALSWILLIYFLFKTPSKIVLKETLALYLIWIQFQNQSISHLIIFWLLVGLIEKNLIKKQVSY